MAIEVIDLSNYRDRFGSRVPEGDYLVEIDEIEVGKSSNNDPMWTVFLRIVGGEYDGNTLVDRLTQTEKAMFRVVGFLNGMGVKTGRKKLKVDLDRLTGRKVRVSVSDGDPFNGTIRSEVRGYTRFVSAKSAPTGDDFENLEESDEETEEEQVEEAEEAPAKPAKVKKPAPEPVEEDDEDEEDSTPETDDSREIDLDDLDI